MNVMHCCQGVVAVDPMTRDRRVLGKRSGTKCFVQFTNSLMLHMKMWSLVCGRDTILFV